MPDRTITLSDMEWVRVIAVLQNLGINPLTRDLTIGFSGRELGGMLQDKWSERVKIDGQKEVEGNR